VLARVALAEGASGAAGFTLIRLLSGAVILAVLLRLHGQGTTLMTAGSWRGALTLLGYAGLFSFAYLSLSTGTGALVLFALVQITMLGVGYASGERLSGLQWLGALAAVGGLVWLLLPGIEAPSPIGALAMGGAGVCWGAYSLMGRNGGEPLLRTAGNFWRAGVMALPLLLIFVLGRESAPTTQGVMWAVLSGAVTSGLGYAVWYRVLPNLSASRAGIVQLLVPPLAALGGIIWLSEPLTVRFVLASAVILGGIALATQQGRGGNSDGSGAALREDR